MRKLITLLVAITLTASVFAQVPQKMSYQAVIRNSSDALVPNTQIGMEINILQGSATGTVVYTETQTPTTNANGLVSIKIGSGAGFSTIDWASDIYFIETKIAIVSPLTTYTITGVSQLLSVPYALHAKTAESVIGTNTSKKYRLEYVSGDGQIYDGGGMPNPMVFKIFNITDNVYVTSLPSEGLSIFSTGNIGYEDGNFNNSNNYCGNGSQECYGGYYYIPSTNLPTKPFNLIISVTLKYSNTNEVVERYIINQYIQ